MLRTLLRSLYPQADVLRSSIASGLRSLAHNTVDAASSDSGSIVATRGCDRSGSARAETEQPSQHAACAPTCMGVDKGVDTPGLCSRSTGPLSFLHFPSNISATLPSTSPPLQPQQQQQRKQLWQQVHAHTRALSTSATQCASPSPACLTTSRHLPGHQPASRHPPPHPHTPHHPSPPSPATLDPATFPANSQVTASPLVVLQRGQPPREMSLTEALTVAEGAGEDLVQLPLTVDPPVAVLLRRSMFAERREYGYERLRIPQSPRKPKLYEVQVKVRIATNDLDRKLQSVRRQLEDGNRVSFAVDFSREQDPEEAAQAAQACLSKALAWVKQSNIATAGGNKKEAGLWRVQFNPIYGVWGKISPQVEAAHNLLRRMAGVTKDGGSD